MKNKEIITSGDVDSVTKLLVELLEVADELGRVTVSDYNYILGKESTYKDDMMGWTADIIEKLNTTTVNKMGRLEYQLTLPEPMIFADELGRGTVSGYNHIWVKESTYPEPMIFDDNNEESKEDENEK